MVGRIIDSDACVAEGTAALIKLEPRFALVSEITGPWPLRRKPDGFVTLMSAIVSQQISVAAAASIWARLEQADLVEMARVAAASEGALRACGLSGPKVRYVKAVAQSGTDYAALRSMPNEDVVETLVKLPGIGPWSAQIYAMFSLGRADAFAPGDLALREAARLLFELQERPTEKQLRHRAENWSPWRSVAARGLFAYYRVMKAREGL